MFLYGKSYFVNKKKVGLVNHHRNCKFVMENVYTKLCHRRSPQLFRTKKRRLSELNIFFYLLLLWLEFEMFLVNRETQPLSTMMELIQLK